MPDFDPKNIPVLEDIIKEDISEPETTADDGVADNIALDNAGHAEMPRADENLDLFTAEPAARIDDAHFTAPADAGEDLHLDEHQANPTENISAADAAATDPSAEVIHIAGASSEISEQSLSSFSAIDDALADDDSEDHDIIIDLAVTQVNPDTELNAENNDPSAWQQEDEDDEFIESALIDYQHPDTPPDNEAGEHHHGDDNVIEPATTEDEVHSEDETGYLVEAQRPQTKLAPPQEQGQEQQPAKDSPPLDLQPQDLQPRDIQPLDLQPLIDDIIKQLMPDLEQQLRFLVRQALEDKLPDSIINNEEPQEERHK